MNARRVSALSLLFLVATTSALAGSVQDLGTVGTVYAISEPNFLAELRARAPELDMDKQRENHAHFQPKDLHKLPRATTNRTFDVDMAYTIKHAIKDGSGHILYPTGFAYNPLRYGGFLPGLVVIDGSDPHQVEWYEKSPYFNNKGAMLLVSDGFALELTEKFKRPVYYLTDIIATRLRLAAAPSIVVKNGDALTVREVKIEQ